MAGGYPGINDTPLRAAVEPVVVEPLQLVPELDILRRPEGEGRDVELQPAVTRRQTHRGGFASEVDAAGRIPRHAVAGDRFTIDANLAQLDRRRSRVLQEASWIDDGHAGAQGHPQPA